MIVPKIARYDRCVIKAYEFLDEFLISHYPIDAIEIILNKKWGLVKYSELARNFNCSISDVIKSLGSEDGYTIYDDYNYTIAYNDRIKYKKRIAFTLFHEIGHIYLGHLIDFNATKLRRGCLTNSENNVLENESNAFARNVLMPAVILRNMDFDPELVASQFGVSISAAETRLCFLDTDLEAIENSGIYEKVQRVYNRYNYAKSRKSGHQFINYVALDGFPYDII